MIFKKTILPILLFSFVGQATESTESREAVNRKLLQVANPHGFQRSEEARHAQLILHKYNDNASKEVVLEDLTKLIKGLVDRGADINTIEFGEAPLHSATKRGDILTEAFLISGANPNIRRGLDGETPLHVAAFLGQVSTMKVLVKGGASPYIKDHYGYTPIDKLDLRSKRWQEKVIKDILLEYSKYSERLPEGD